MRESPIEAAKKITPSWFTRIPDYDGLEIHPVRVYETREDKTFCEQCEPEEADFWSVYGHLIEGGVECIDDFAAEAQAERFASQLLEA